jgi:hypothetical protein
VKLQVLAVCETTSAGDRTRLNSNLDTTDTGVFFLLAFIRLQVPLHSLQQTPKMLLHINHVGVLQVS